MLSKLDYYGQHNDKRLENGHVFRIHVLLTFSPIFVVSILQSMY